MLLALMYHRVGYGKHATPLHTLIDHFTLLKDYPILLPGDPIPQGQLSFCLTFDDAFFDFYHLVFPLLQKFQLPAVLGVPTRYIVESTVASPQERLAVPYALAMQDGIFDTKAPLCTWSELQDLAYSKLIHIASHSYSHGNLTFPFMNLEQEVICSKKILEERLSKNISSFIFPFGRTHRQLNHYVAQHYTYSFRIGRACNFSWTTPLAPMCRVCADNTTLKELLSPKHKCFYFAKGLIERCLKQR